MNRAITIYEIAFGKHHPSVARSINNLAFIYRNQGKFEKALSYYNKALNRLSFSSEIDIYNLPNTTETAIILQNRQYILNKLAENDSSFARKAFNNSINTLAFLEQLRTGIESQKSKIKLWVEQSSSFELALQSYLLIQQKGVIAKDEAYIFLESALSRTLFEQLLNRFKIKGKDIKTEILQKEQAFLKRQNLLEKSIIKANDETQRREIKEAYLKAIGEGMRLSPDNLEFAIESGNIKLRSVKGIFEQEDWLFKNISFSKDYIGTLAYKGSQGKLKIRKNSIPVPISTAGYCHEIFLPHALHLPFCAIKLTTGISSYHAKI